MTPVPHPLFIGICLQYEWPAQFGIYVHDGFWSYDFHNKEYTGDPVCTDKECRDDDLHDEVIRYLQQYQVDHHCKIIMAGLVNSTEDIRLRNLGRKLWKDLDILPCIINATGTSIDEKACSVARKTTQWLTPSLIPGLSKVHVGYRHEVEVDANGRMAFADLEDYQPFISPETWKEILQTSALVKEKGKRIVFFNSTPQGGGVAIIRHSTLRFFKLLGIDAHWFVMKPNPEVFEITKKKFHNVLQGVAPADTCLTEADKTLWQNWCKNNVESYWTEEDCPVSQADVIVIDDPQPSGMITRLKEINPTATFVYRSHIELRSDLIRDPTTETHKVFTFLWDQIQKCDIFISHPVAKFVPDIVKASSIKVIEMPAITDPIDGLNKNLDSYAENYYQLLFNRIELDQSGKRVDLSRPYFIQVARFDPSKGIPELIDSYMKFRKRKEVIALDLQEIPQLVITGVGSVDDPEGSVLYDATIDKVKRLGKQKNGKEITEDIHVARLGPSDQMLNAMLTRALAAFQNSSREGFEVKVSEALLKGVPVVGTETGGIPLQIKDRHDGFLVPVGDIKRVAEVMSKLTIDKEYTKMLSTNAKKELREHVLTPVNVIRWNKILLGDY